MTFSIVKYSNNLFLYLVFIIKISQYCCYVFGVESRGGNLFRHSCRYEQGNQRTNIDSAKESEWHPCWTKRQRG